ncbi:MAG: DUF1761 domain-containing protein [Pseudomonadota bacterium]
MKGINWIGVFVALVVSQAIGYVWYGVVFSDQWMAASGMTAAEMDESALTYVRGAVQNLVVIVGLAWLAVQTGKSSWTSGAVLGALVCVFFALSTYALRFIYGNDSTALIPIDAGYMLIQYVVSGAIVAGLSLGKPAAA